MRTASLSLLLIYFVFAAPCALAEEKPAFDDLTREQAALEKQQLAEGKRPELSPAMQAFGQSAEKIFYTSGDYQLHGYLYKPAGQNPFPAVIWNHGSELEPTRQPELARFYTSRGFAFFLPVRHGHGPAPGPYVVDLQQKLAAEEKDPKVIEQKIVELHELYNQDVVAAVEWLKQQKAIDRDRLIMSGVSYGGIQTVLTAEKKLGLRGYIPFAPAAMTIQNTALRDRLLQAAKNAQAPVLLIQAENDYSTEPAKLLGPLLEEHGLPSRAKIYPPFGATHQEGHSLFARSSLGLTLWGPDVLEFIDAALRQPQTPP